MTFKVLGGTVASLFITILLALSWVESEPGSQWLLEKMKAAAEAQPGISFRFEKGKIKPFSSVSMRGMKLGIQRDGMDLTLEIPEFEAKYDISLLKRSLRFENLSILGLKLSGKMELPANPEPEDTEQTSPTDWASVRQMLDAPPAALELQALRLQKASIDISFSKKGGAPLEGRVLFPLIDAELKARLAAGKAEGSSSLRLNDPNNLIRLKLTVAKTEESPAYSDELSFAPSAMFTGGFEVATPENPNTNWRFDLQGDKSSFKILRFVMDRTFTESKLAPWRIRFNEQALEASVHATPERINLDIEHHGSPILVRMEKELPALQPSFSAKLGTTPDLRSFNLLSEIYINRVKLLQTELKGGIEAGATKIALSSNLHTDSRLGSIAPILKSYPEVNVGLESLIEIPATKIDEDRRIEVTKLTSTFQGQEYLSGKMATQLSPKRTDANGELRLRPPASVFNFLKKAGLWRTNEKPLLTEMEKALLTASLDTHFKASQTVSGEQSEISWEGSSRLAGIGVLSDTELPEPLSFNHTFKQVTPPKGAQTVSGSFVATIPQLTWKKEVDARDTRFDLAFTSTADLHPVMKMSWNATQNTLSVRDPASRNLIPLQGIKSSGEFTIDENGTMTGKNMLFSIHQDLFKIRMDITGNERTGKAEIVGNASVRVPKKFPEIAGNRLAGSMEMPWTIQVREGKEILVQGQLLFRDMAWSNGRYGFSGLSGKMSLTEALQRQGDKIIFARIENPNAFERVDFERIQPYLQEADRVQILDINYEDRRLGPFFGYFSVYQNLLAVNQFNLKLGKEGRAYGELFVDANPAQLRMGFLSRLTALDLSELLPSRLLKQAAEGNKTISGRGGLVINLTKSTVEGRMDINEIGGAQLITMMRALDPKGKDEKISRACSALGLAYPTFVGMTFNSGLMDMKIDMSLPAPSMTLRGIPIAGSVASSFAPLKEMLARAGYTQTAATNP